MKFQIPDTIKKALDMGAKLAISISGGKDSQAMLNLLVHSFGLADCAFAIHADLGRAEWKQTPAHVERTAQDAGVALVVVRREKGDLLDRFQERRAKLEGTGKPFWASAAARYCTSDLKRNPIDKFLRSFELVISCEGIRADESPARARKAPVEVRRTITGKYYREMSPAEAVAAYNPNWNTRLALTWRPLLDATTSDVWKLCGTTMEDVEARKALYAANFKAEALAGWTAHPAYIFGNERLSCALCVLGSKGDLVRGAQHNPELFLNLLEMERESGCSFRQDISLQDIAGQLPPN